MKIRNFVLSFMLISASSLAQAGGSPEEQAACRPDVRRFCHHLRTDEGDMAFLACLQEHRAKLTPKCLNVLVSNGQ
jgi:hypothetical protein